VGSGVIEFVSATTALVVAGALGMASIGHLIGFPHFRATLERQAVLPHRLRALSAAVAIAVEPMLSVAILVALLKGDSVWLSVLTAGGCVTFVVYALYLRVLWHRGTSVECGCFPLTREVASRASVLRSLLLAGAAAVAAAGARVETGAVVDGGQFAVMTLAASVFVIAAAVLPAALAVAAPTGVGSSR
jgi:hypothetical protein